MPTISFGTTDDPKKCEALDVEITLLQGKQLEPREYYLSRPAQLFAPIELPRKTRIAATLGGVFGATDD